MRTQTQIFVLGAIFLAGCSSALKKVEKFSQSHDYQAIVSLLNDQIKHSQSAETNAVVAAGVRAVLVSNDEQAIGQISWFYLGRADSTPYRTTILQQFNALHRVVQDREAFARRFWRGEDLGSTADVVAQFTNWTSPEDLDSLTSELERTIADVKVADLAGRIDALPAVAKSRFACLALLTKAATNKGAQSALAKVSRDFVRCAGPELPTRLVHLAQTSGEVSPLLLAVAENDPATRTIAWDAFVGDLGNSATVGALVLPAALPESNWEHAGAVKSVNALIKAAANTVDEAKTIDRRVEEAKVKIRDTTKQLKELTETWTTLYAYLISENGCPISPN